MLLEQLRELGEALPVSASPTVAELPLIVAGLVHYAETGSLVPPVVVAPPTPAAQATIDAETSRIAELEGLLATAERQNAAAAAAPAAVLPAPVAPAAPVPPSQASTPAVTAPGVEAPPVSAVPSAPSVPSTPGS